MVRAGRVASGGADPAVALFDEVFDLKAFVFSKTHEIANAFVKQLGESFGKSIGEGLNENGGVVVAPVAKRLGVFFDFVPGGGNESAEKKNTTANGPGPQINEG